MIYMNFPIHAVVLLLCLLQPGNTVDIQVQGHPELSVKIAVMPDGYRKHDLDQWVESCVDANERPRG